MRAVFLENEKLRVGVLADKGTDVIEFNYKPRDVDFVWLTAGGVRNPTAPDGPGGQAGRGSRGYRVPGRPQGEHRDRWRVQGRRRHARRARGCLTRVSLF